jgi:anti-sigma regulatory factor (Ser/Thr protein kinase)
VSAGAPRLEARIQSDPSGLPDIREQMQAWLSEQDWPEDGIAELVLALDEALTNVIRHGYGGRCDQPIEVVAVPVHHPTEGAGVEVRVRDFGQQVALDQICGRDLDDVRPGGLGVHIIRSMTNSAEYQHAEGGGMLLILRKYKTHQASRDKNKGREP